MGSVFSEHARKYYEMGLNVIPVQGKVPIIQAWQAYSTSPMTDGEFDNFEIKFQTGNIGIGLVLGEASKVIALDIDTDDKKILDSLPKSTCVRRGKKGEVRFFKWRAGLSNKSIKGVLDFMVTGRQVVLPPSVHPDGMNYVWTGSTGLDDNLPDWPEYNFEFKPSVGGSGEGRNNTLKNQASAALFAGDKSIQTIAEELYEYDLVNHSPPLFSDSSEPHMGKGKESAYNFVLRISKSIPKPTEPVKIQAELVIKKIEKNNIPVITKEDGLLFNFMNLFTQVTTQKIHGVGIGCGISLISACIGNRIRLGSIYPNTFCLNIAGTGQGKSQGMKLIKFLLRDLDIIGAGTYRSKKAIHEGFLASGNGSRVRIDLIDEISGLFRHMNSKTGNAFSVEMAETFCSLYTASNDQLDGIKQATQENSIGLIRNPYGVILGATTPEMAASTFNTEMISQGLITRFLVCKDELLPEDFNIEPPNMISMNELKGLSEMRAGINELWALPWESEARAGIVKVNPGEWGIICTNIKWGTGSLALLEDTFRKKIGIKQRNAKQDWEQQGLSRLYENLIKLCIIHWASRFAVGLSTIDEGIEPQSVTWADKILSWSFNSFCDFFGGLSETHDGSSVGTLGQKLSRAKEKLRKIESGASVYKKDFYKFFNGNIDKVEINKVIASFEDQGLVTKMGDFWLKI